MRGKRSGTTIEVAVANCGDSAFNTSVGVFGFGPHFCPGNMLARLESELLVDALLDRVPGLKLAVPPGQVPFKKGALIRGPEALPVTW